MLLQNVGTRQCRVPTSIRNDHKATTKKIPTCKMAGLQWGRIFRHNMHSQLDTSFRWNSWWKNAIITNRAFLDRMPGEHKKTPPPYQYFAIRGNAKPFSRNHRYWTDGHGCRVPTHEERVENGIQNHKRPLLSTYIGSLKSAITKYAHTINSKFKWQQRYHDHAIRGTKDRNIISQYIENNPVNWDCDCFNRET